MYAIIVNEFSKLASSVLTFR